MFIDSVKIYVKSGSGGKGCFSFYRDNYVPKGIPNGGDGGKGADIIIRADRNLRTLLDFRYNRHFYGSSGGAGGSNNKKGRDSAPVIIRVPCGTTIKEIKTGCVLGDLSKDRQELIVACGGRGGLGNYHHKEGSPPQPGEEKELLLDLKLIADAGVIGFPNAGKSTLITNISNARPQIAAYPFTTKFPVLGTVGQAEDSFVIADIPGLIEGSSCGRGLGYNFLRHIERTRLLVHLIDMAGFEGRDPVRDYKILNKELKNYSRKVSGLPQVIVANKMDLEGASENLSRFKKLVRKKIYPVSALKKEGLEELIAGIRKKI